MPKFYNGRTNINTNNRENTVPTSNRRRRFVKKNNPNSIRKEINASIKAENTMLALKRQKQRIQREMKKEAKLTQFMGTGYTPLYRSGREATLPLTLVSENNRTANARRKNQRGEEDSAMFSFKGMTLDYLNLLVNPLTCANLARIPDNDKSISVPLVDFLVSNQFTAQALGTGSVYGVLIFFSYGYNKFWQDNRQQLAGDDLYFIAYSFVDSSGKLLSSGSSDFLGQKSFVNQDSILYTSPIEAPVPELAQAIRIISLGLRALPTIEQNVGASGVPYINKFYGGQIQPNTLHDSYWIDDDFQNSFDNYITTNLNTKCYQNNEGVCVRLNPFQNSQNTYNFAKYASNEELCGQYNGANPPSYPAMFGTLATPFIYIKFSQGIAPSSTTDGVSTYTCPFYFDCRLILEAVLQQPTPIYSTPSPIDPDWDKVVSVMNAMPEDEFPYVTKGHSFKSFMSGVGKAIGFAKKFLKFGTDIIGPIESIYSSSTMMY